MPGYKNPRTAGSLNATNLLCAVMEMAGLRAVVVDDDVLRLTGGDALRVITRDLDRTLRDGVFRLEVTRNRSPIIVPGHLGITELTRAARVPTGPTPSPARVEHAVRSLQASERELDI